MRGSEVETFWDQQGVGARTEARHATAITASGTVSSDGRAPVGPDPLRSGTPGNMDGFELKCGRSHGLRRRLSVDARRPLPPQKP